MTESSQFLSMNLLLLFYQRNVISSCLLNSYLPQMCTAFRHHQRNFFVPWTAVNIGSHNLITMPVTVQLKNGPFISHSSARLKDRHERKAKILQESQFGKDQNKTASSGHDNIIVLKNSQQLQLPTEDMCKIKLVNILVRNKSGS